MLEAASVAGSECAVAAVAAGLEHDMEAVEDCCAGLAQRGQFLVGQWDRDLAGWDGGRALPLAHALYQEVVYDRVPEGRRLRLHRRIGDREEAGYGAQAGENAAELAVHFVRGQDSATGGAVSAAGGGRMRSSAMRYREAIGSHVTGLELLATLPETPARASRSSTCRSPGAGVDGHQGLGGPGGGADLCPGAGVVRSRSARRPSSSRRCGVYGGSIAAGGRCRRRGSWGNSSYRLAQRAADPTHLLEAHDALGVTLFYLGDYAAARTHFEQGIALIDPTAQRALALHHGEAPGVRCLVMAAQTLWCLGYPAQALQRSQEALALAQELAHPYSLALAQHYAAFLHHRRREVPAVQAQAEALLTLATAQGFPLWVGLGTCWRGWALAMQGQGEAGMAQIHQGLAAVLATGQTLARPLCLVLLAEAAGHAGQVEEGLRLLAEALTAFEASGQGDLLAEAYRLQGELAAAPGRPGCGPGRSLLPAGPGHCPPPAGQVLGAAGRHEPEPAVAAAGQARRGPRPAGADLWLVHRGL